MKRQAFSAGDIFTAYHHIYTACIVVDHKQALLFTIPKVQCNPYKHLPPIWLDSGVATE
jgi:hypothetical protein